MKHYSVNEAAAELANTFKEDRGCKFLRAAPYPNYRKSVQPRGRVKNNGWTQEIIKAIAAGKLRGMMGNGRPVDIEKPGAFVAAIVCSIRADDLNVWLNSMGNEYRFDENEAAPAASRQTKVTVDIDTTNLTSEKPVDVRAKELAQEAGEQLRAKNKQRSITVSSVQNYVAEGLKKEGYQGERGPYEASGLKNRFLKGWKFQETLIKNIDIR